MHLKPINQYLSQGTLLSLALLGQNLPLLTSATGSAGPPGCCLLWEQCLAAGSSPAISRARCRGVAVP